MTRNQWSKMTEVQKRTRIAQLCGLKNIHLLDGVSLVYGYIPSTATTLQFILGDVPRYTTDLNAMHKVEKVLRKKKPLKDGTVLHYVYESLLITLTSGEPVYATPAQKAEAFVLAMEIKPKCATKLCDEVMSAQCDEFRSTKSWCL